jgi:conjugative transfer ATPase
MFANLSSLFQAKAASPKAEPERAQRKPLTVAQRKRMAQRPPSFTELLPWTQFEPTDEVFVHHDGLTLGAMLEFSPVGTEAKPDAFLEEVQANIQAALHSIDECDPPWVLQLFANDDRNLEPLKKEFAQYIQTAYPKDPARSLAIFNSDYTQDFITEMARHLDLVCKPEGLFVDTQVSGQPWRGQVRRVRCFVYKKFPVALNDTLLPQSQLQARVDALTGALARAGIGARRCCGKDLYDWLLPFFNPKPGWCEASGVANNMPYPGDTKASGAASLTDFAELFNLSEPQSDVEAGVWRFDGCPVKALVLQNLTKPPTLGHFTAESLQGERTYARFDRLPPGAMLSITTVIEGQHKVRAHVERIQMKSRALNADAQITHRECEQVLERLAQGDKFFPAMVTLYVSAADDAQLGKAISDVNSELGPSGLRFIDPRHDLVALDAFIQALPMAFDPAFDAKLLRRSRLMFASQIAALLPLYGRSRGTGNPGVWMWNRGGEPLLFDPLSPKDRKKNAHLLMLGPTGAGKSATLNFMAMMAMAIHRPRLVIVDAGKSFGLLLEHFKKFGLSTYCVDLSHSNDQSAGVSLPPFVHGPKLLQDKGLMDAASSYSDQIDTLAQESMASDGALLADARELSERVVDVAKEVAIDDSEPEEKRDYLGEMMIAATMMITGGEKKEIERMTRADRYLVSRAIIKASIAAHRAGQPHPLTSDVAHELRAMANDLEMTAPRRERAEEMGQAMGSFSEGLRGKLFNRYGQDWPEVDVTLVEMGALTQGGNTDALSLAYTSLIDSVQSRGEKFQFEGRPLVFLTDEAHLITTSELLGPKIATAAKMWRKLMIWLWLATQNMKDFPDSMSRVLSMCEWWLMLTMDKSEIDEVARFRTLTHEQRTMMESAVKEPAKYTEGVVMSAMGQMLFRNVPPALPIALAMTEGHEKADRKRLMDKHGCSEMDAARMVARELEACRG